MSSSSAPYVAAAVIAERVPNIKPRVGLILGSGLAEVADNLEDAVTIPYADLPGFRPGTVGGHRGGLVLGYRAGVPVACLAGRSHLYEGIDPAELTTPVRTLKLLGVETLLVTNASGSIRQEIPPGSLVALTDHINFLGINPLVGPNDESFGPRFPGMHDAYDAELRELLRRAADEVDAKLHEGVYIACLGPSFETQAEVKAFGLMGADVVGMSTVPEVIVARHAGMRVASVSVVTNYAAEGELSHEHTLATAKTASAAVQALINRWIELVGAAQ